MDTTLFTNESPGRLVPINAEWGADHAFIPEPLPPNWDFPVSLWPLLAEAKSQVSLLEGIGRNLQNPAILLRPLSGREALQSSALEGTYSTAEELLLFELNPAQPQSEDDPVNARLEVFNYQKALDHGTHSDLPIAMRLIREIHRILLTGVRGRDKAPGEFRRVPVGIGAGGRFIPPPHEHVVDGLSELEKFIHNSTSGFDPLVVCYLVHYQFETIHPFKDGNGRIGRVLLAIMIQQLCGLSKPWLYMSGFFNRYRDEYTQHLFNISAKGEWSSWVEFCLQGTLEQAKDTITRCERLCTLKDNYMKRLTDSGGATRLIQIIEDIFDSPFVRIADLHQRLGVSDPTARSDAERLVDAGILKELPNARPKVYYAPEVFSVAYDNLD